MTTVEITITSSICYLVAFAKDNRPTTDGPASDLMAYGINYFLSDNSDGRLT